MAWMLAHNDSDGGIVAIPSGGSAFMVKIQGSHAAAPAVRVVIASGATLTRVGLSNLLGESRDIQVAAACRDESEALDAVQRELPDVLILEPALLRRMSAALDGLSHLPRILLFSSSAHCGADSGAIEQACGFLSERASMESMRANLEDVLRCPRTSRGSDCPSQCRALRTLVPPRLPLTAREYTVFLHIGEGQSNQAIAAALGVSVKTIEAHRESIKRKLGLHNAVRLSEAAMLWRRGEFEAPQSSPPALRSIPVRRSA